MLKTQVSWKGRRGGGPKSRGVFFFLFLFYFPIPFDTYHTVSMHMLNLC